MRSQAGGLARRVGLDRALASAQPDAPRVWADAGNFAAGEDTPSAHAKTTAIVSSFGQLAIRAVNVADREVSEGLDVVATAAREAGVPLTSASLVLPDGSTAFPPALVVRAGGRSILGLEVGGVSVGFVGLARHVETTRGSLGGKAVATRPAGEALAAGLSAAREKRADVVVLLAALPPDEVRALVAATPGVDVAIGSHGKTHVFERGRPVIAFVGERGQDVLELAVGECGPDGLEVAERVHRLDPRYPEDPAMLALQRETSRKVNEWSRKAAIEAARLAPSPPPATFAGVTACRPCHVEEHLAWEKSGHARALATLAAASADFNAECLRCHVTGLGQGGFRSAVETPELGGVQCEACHGPAREHAGSGGRVKPEGRAGACVSCHDADNSPSFDFPAYWQRIRHGATAGGAGRTAAP